MRVFNYTDLEHQQPGVIFMNERSNATMWIDRHQVDDLLHFLHYLKDSGGLNTNSTESVLTLKSRDVVPEHIQEKRRRQE